MGLNSKAVVYLKGSLAQEAGWEGAWGGVRETQPAGEEPGLAAPLPAVA